MNRFFRFPWLVVAVIAAVTVFFALQLPRVILDNDVVNFIPKDSPEVKAYEAQQDLYGSQIIMLMALKNPGGTVFEKDFLLKVKELTSRLQALPLTESVTSLTNTDYIRGEGDSIVVSPLAGKDFTGTPAEVNALKEGVLSWDLYHGSLVSKDFQSTQILITIKPAADNEAAPANGPPVDNKKVMYADVQKVLSEIDLGNLQVYLAGMPVMAVLMSINMAKDLVLLIPLVVLVIVLSLYFSFRRLGGVLLPLAGVVISSIWTIGLMALLGVKLTMIATVIPVILVAVGSAYGIHVVSHYYDAALTQQRTLSQTEYHDLVLGVLKKIGIPVLLAGLTTMAGFGSLAFTSILPVRDFGYFSTFGVFAALVVALTFIPALLLIRGPHPVKGENTYDPDQDVVSRALLKAFTPFVRHPKSTLFFSVVVVAVSLWGATKIVVDNATVEFFKGDTEISRADKFLSTDFAGTKTFNINVKGSQKGDLNDPEVLAAMDDLAAYLESDFPEVGKVISYSQFIKRMNQVLNADEPADGLRGATATATAAVDENAEVAFGFGFDEPAPAAETKAVSVPVAENPTLTRAALLELLNQAYLLSDRQDIPAVELLSLINRTVNYQGSAYYEIPRDPERYNQADKQGLKNLIGNYLVLVGAGTEEWSDDALEPTQARMSIQVNSSGNIATGKIAEAVKVYTAAHFPKGVTVEMAGMAFIEKGVTDLIVLSQVWNILSSLVLVIVILTIFFRSFLAGWLAIIPLSVSIVVNFGLMGFFGIKLDAATSMVAAIAIGTGIDYTIHFLVAFHRGRKEYADFHAVMDKTILRTGKAIMFNAVSVAAGFAVLALSTFNPLMYLGILIAVTMATSSFVALTLMPVLLELLKPKFLDKPMLDEVLGGKK